MIIAYRSILQVFSQYGLLYKVTRHPRTTEPTVKDGITHGEVWDLLEGFFTRTLGEGDHNTIIEKALQFADFNNDEEVGDCSVQQFCEMQESLLDVDNKLCLLDYLFTARFGIRMMVYGEVLLEI